MAQQDRINNPFAGVHPVLHLPLSSNPNHRDDIDYSDLTGLVHDMISFDPAGLVVLGLATEAWALQGAERTKILETVAKAVDGRVAVTVGIDGPTAAAVAAATEAASFGCSGLLVRPPDGVPSTAALRDHLHKVASASGLPIAFQDVPQTTGLKLSISELVELCDGNELIAAIKTEIPGAGPRVSAAVDAGLDMIAGWGGLNYPEMISRGAIGCMPGCDLGPALVEVDHLHRAGDTEAALRRYRQLLSILAVETSSLDLLILGAKHLLHRRRVISSAQMRSPRRQLDLIEQRGLDLLFDDAARAGVPGFLLAPDTGSQTSTAASDIVDPVKDR